MRTSATITVAVALLAAGAVWLMGGEQPLPPATGGTPAPTVTDRAMSPPSPLQRVPVANAPSASLPHRRVVPPELVEKLAVADRSATAQRNDPGVAELQLPERRVRPARAVALATALRLPADSPHSVWLGSWLDNNADEQRRLAEDLAPLLGEERARAVETFNRAALTRLHNLVTRLGVAGALEVTRRVKVHTLSAEGRARRVDALGRLVFERELTENY